MSETPNPWSSNGGPDSGAPSSTTHGQQPTWQRGSSSARPQFTGASQPYAPRPAGGSPGWQQADPRAASGAGWSSQPRSQQQPLGSSSATGIVAAPKRRRGAGKVAASVLGLALLAGGVGAGSAVLTTQYLQSRQPAAISSGSSSAQSSSDEAATEGSSSGTTVKQADPSNPNWTAVADVASKSVVAIDVASANGGGQGSGVVIDAAGNILTNNHVVNGAEQIRVTLGDQTYEAKLVGTDPSTDLAVIRLVDPPSDLQPMQWGDSQVLKVGDPVMAIGNPLGLSNTVTTGIVSALDRPVTTQAVGSEQRRMRNGSDAVVTAAIQTNAAINPGNSGGALVNSSGELVGITSSIASLSGGQENGAQSGNIGIGFAIGSYQARHVAKQLIDNGKAVYPQIGITARDVQSTGQMGAEIAEVVDGSPAAKAGLRSGDIVTAVEGREVSSTSQLVGLVRAQQVGQRVKVAYIRDGEEHTVEMELVASGR